MLTLHEKAHSLDVNMTDSSEGKDDHEEEGEEEEEMIIEEEIVIDEEEKKGPINFFSKNLFKIRDRTKCWIRTSLLHLAISGSKERFKKEFFSSKEFQPDTTTTTIVNENQTFVSDTGYLPIFAVDKSVGEGKKAYFYGGYEEFIKNLLLMEKKDRNFYEIFMPSLPCHLHIDAEFKYAPNSNTPEKPKHFISAQKKPLELEEELFKVIKEQMITEKYIENEKEWLNNVEILIQDASSEKKFSRHYIFKISKKAFKNNMHCGAFMRRVEVLILKRFGEVYNNPFYLWNDKEKNFSRDDTTRKVWIVDLSIYNKHRAWRTLGCVKLGENDIEQRTLKPINKKIDDIDQDMILNSFAQRVSPDATIITCFEFDGSAPVSSGVSKESRLKTKKFVTHEIKEKPIVQEIENKNDGDDDSREGYSHQHIHPNKKKKFSHDGHGMIVKDTDQFITEFLNDDSNTIIINHDKNKKNDSVLKASNPRSLSTITHSEVMNAIIKDIQTKNPYASDLDTINDFRLETRVESLKTSSKQCDIKGGAHTNNHIYFTIQWDEGTFRQQCHSEICKNSSRKLKPYHFSQSTKNIMKKYLEKMNTIFESNEIVDEGIDFISF